MFIIYTLVFAPPNASLDLCLSMDSNSKRLSNVPINLAYGSHSLNSQNVFE